MLRGPYMAAVSEHGHSVLSPFSFQVAVIHAKEKLSGIIQKKLVVKCYILTCSLSLDLIF